MAKRAEREPLRVPVGHTQRTESIYIFCILEFFWYFKPKSKAVHVPYRYTQRHQHLWYFRKILFLGRNTNRFGFRPKKPVIILNFGVFPFRTRSGLRSAILWVNQFVFLWKLCFFGVENKVVYVYVKIMLFWCKMWTSSRSGVKIMHFWCGTRTGSRSSVKIVHFWCGTRTASRSYQKIVHFWSGTRTASRSYQKTVHL